MRLKRERVAPLDDANLTPAQAQILERWRPDVPPLARVLGHVPEAFAAIAAMGRYLGSPDYTLGARERELIILRVAWRSRCGYEWSAHAAAAARAGLDGETLAALKRPGREGLVAADAALVRAVDELDADRFVSEAGWAELAAHYSERQRMDVILTAAQYSQLALLLNTFGVQLRPNQTLDPDLVAYA